jgi:hypothetical protein
MIMIYFLSDEGEFTQELLPDLVGAFGIDEAQHDALLLDVEHSPVADMGFQYFFLLY